MWCSYWMIRLAAFLVGMAERSGVYTVSGDEYRRVSLISRTIVVGRLRGGMVSFQFL